MGVLLGQLLDNYITGRRLGRPKYPWEGELAEWALNMLEAGYDSPALVEAACGVEWERTCRVFEALLAELGIAPGPDAIDDDLIDSVCIEEYKRGYIDTSCHLLWQRDHLREKLGYPYHLHLGKYYTSDDAWFQLGWHTVERAEPKHLPPVMHTGELLRFTDDFLRRAGIARP